MSALENKEISGRLSFVVKSYDLKTLCELHKEDKYDI